MKRFLLIFLLLATTTFGQTYNERLNAEFEPMTPAALSATYHTTLFMMALFPIDLFPRFHINMAIRAGSADYWHYQKTGEYLDKRPRGIPPPSLH